MSDRIALHITGLDTIANFFDYIAGEVLATAITSGPGDGAGTELDLDAEDMGPVTVWLRKAANGA